MTNQEAIYLLSEIRYAIESEYTEDVIEAYDMAIAALDKPKASIEAYAAKMWEDLARDD